MSPRIHITIPNHLLLWGLLVFEMPCVTAFVSLGYESRRFQPNVGGQLHPSCVGPQRKPLISLAWVLIKGIVMACRVYCWLL
jgi:hypothetical protein